MANNMQDASHTDVAKADDQTEREEIVQYLPPRFRDIAASSAAIELFNLMNDDLITDRILPALHSSFRALIANPNARQPAESIVNRLRHLVDSPRTPPSSHWKLLFVVTEKQVKRVKFLECATRDKRLPRLPNYQVFERVSSLPFPFNNRRHFLVEIGEKVVCLTFYDWRNPFTYIMNAALIGGSAFRPLDTSRICEEIERETNSDTASLKGITLKTVVGHRLIVLFTCVCTDLNRLSTHTLCLDVNTEEWSLLPKCPLNNFGSVVSISWQGKLYLLDAANGFPGHVFTHFDFEKNIWVEHEHNVFPQRLMELQKHRIRCIISSRSGTLYAVCDQNDHQYPIVDIYCMDDMTSGWRRVELRRSVYTQQFNPLAIPPLPSHIIISDVQTKIYCWAVNEQDILLLYLHYTNAGGIITWARYVWWIFNHNDGLKNFNCEELSDPSLQNVIHLSVLKFESQNIESGSSSL